MTADDTSSDTEVFRIRSFSIRKPVAFAYLLSTLYNVMFFMQFVAVPYVVKSLHISDTDYGYIQTLFGLLQVAGGPAFGYITQKWGVKVALYVCYINTMLSSILLYASYDLQSLTISRLPVFFMHGQQGHQTLLSLLTRPGKERTNAFGRMGLTFGIGFMLTSILSMVSNKLIGDRASLLTSAALCILPIFVMETCLNRADYDHTSDATSDSKEKTDKPTVEPSATMNWRTSVAVLKKEGVVNILIKKNLPITQMLLIFAILQIYMIEKFEMTQEMNGILQMIIGVCIMFSNGFGVIWMRKHFNEQTLLIIGSVSFMIGFTLFMFFTHLWMFVVIMPFCSLGMSLVATVSDSLLTSLVDEQEQGVVLGVATSFNSFVRTFAPAISGVMMDKFGFTSFGLNGIFWTSIGVAACIFMPIDENLLRRERSRSEAEAEEKKEQ